MKNDGLNSLKYTVEKITEYPLYTLVTVDVKEAFLQETDSTSTSTYDMASQSSDGLSGEFEEIFSMN